VNRIGKNQTNCSFFTETWEFVLDGIILRETEPHDMYIIGGILGDGRSEKKGRGTQLLVTGFISYVGSLGIPYYLGTYGVQSGPSD